MNWIDLVNAEQLATIRKQKIFNIIFKHSTRCSVSLMAKKLFESDWSNDLDLLSIPVYYLDLLNFRELSNQISSYFDVEHQSPQVLVIKDGECKLFLNHQDIDVFDIKKVIVN